MRKRPSSDSFGVRSAAIQKTVQTKKANSIVARVIWWKFSLFRGSYHTAAVRTARKGLHAARQKQNKTRILQTNKKSHGGWCVMRAVCSLHSAGGKRKPKFTINNYEKRSCDRFCMAAARRCQFVLSPNVSSSRLLARIRGFEGPEHAPRTSARALTCDVVYALVPCVHRGRDHEKISHAAREENAPDQKKSIWYRVIYAVYVTKP